MGDTTIHRIDVRALAVLSLAVLIAHAHPPASGQQLSEPEPTRSAATGSGKPAARQLSLTELASLTTAYADRYMTYLVSATDQIERDNPDQKQRRRAHQVKLVQTSAIYDIVTNSDPFTQFLDLALVVSLQARKWIDDDQAEAWFGKRGRALVQASRQAREDIWAIAGRVLRPEQLEQLDSIILAWHRDNPEVEIVSWVRFDEVASSRGKSIVAEVASGGGLLAPVSEASKAVDEMRLLAERAFYLSKRWPFLLTWQARAAIDESIGGTGLAAVQEAVPQIVSSLDRATRSVSRLPADLAREREAITKVFDRTNPEARATIESADELVRNANELGTTAISLTGALDQLLGRIDQTSTSLQGTMKVVDATFLQPGRDKPADPAAKPFDIAQYAATAAEATRALREANQLMTHLQATLDSPRLLAVVEQPVTTAAVATSGLIDKAFWRIAALLLIGFALALAYRLVSVRWLTRPAQSS